MTSFFLVFGLRDLLRAKRREEEGQAKWSARHGDQPQL
jgi:hypothetical protein